MTWVNMKIHDMRPDFESIPIIKFQPHSISQWFEISDIGTLVLTIKYKEPPEIVAKYTG